MRFFIAAFAATAVVCSLTACSSESGTPTSGTSEPAPAESSSGGSSGSSGGSSSGGSSGSSGGSSSGGSSGSSGGSSSGGSSSGASGGSSSGGPITCSPPVIASATLGVASAADKTLLCDYAACPFGGYGKSKSCAGGVTVKAKASAAACTGEPTWTKCAALPVSDFLACQGKLNADPCKALETLTQDADCATLKACAF